MPQQKARPRRTEWDALEARRLDAARAWDGKKPDPRPLGSDALWYDPAPYRDMAENRLYHEFARQDFNITMRDGCRLAVTLYLPSERSAEERIPTLVNVTCYWRSFALEHTIADLITGDPWYVRWLVRRGYAYLMVDARGTGASFGRRAFNFDPEEVEDWTDILDWIVAQPWSNGKIGAEGVSYMGLSAYFALSRRHPALLAAMPKFAFHDFYADMTHPGGVFAERLLRTWSDYAAKLQQNDAKATPRYTLKLLATGVRPTDDDKDGSLCKAAILEHAGNTLTYPAVRSTEFRDLPMAGLTGQSARTIDDFSPHRYANEVEKSATPIYSIGGWYDGAFLNGTIKRFVRHNGSQDRLIIGPWDHGAGQNISPGSPSRRPASLRFFEFFRFFDHHLRGLNTGIQDEPRVHYFTMVEERWKSSNIWPPPAVIKTMYLLKDRQLSPTKPRSASGSDDYKVDMTAGTGRFGRWHTIVNVGNMEQETDDIGYPQRASQIAKLLSYTSAPLSEDIEVTGHPTVVLHVSSDQEDGAFHVYLDDIAPNGLVNYVTEGVLRGTHRKLAPSPFPIDVPYHSHREADRLPMVPGEIITLEIELLPTSFLFRKGHQVCLSVAGADCDNFELIPPTGEGPALSVYRSARYPSRLRLPVIRKTGQRSLKHDPAKDGI